MTCPLVVFGNFSTSIIVVVFVPILEPRVPWSWRERLSRDQLIPYRAKEEA